MIANTKVNCTSGSHRFGLMANGFIRRRGLMAFIEGLEGIKAKDDDGLKCISKTDFQRAQKAQEMSSKGFLVRTIAERLGATKAVISNDLKTDLTLIRIE